MYLEHFQEMKPYYEHEMSRLSASTISCNHTFKVSRNIVTFRNVDSHFVNQFNNLFIVLNEKKRSYWAVPHKVMCFQRNQGFMRIGLSSRCSVEEHISR